MKIYVDDTTKNTMLELYDSGNSILSLTKIFNYKYDVIRRVINESGRNIRQNNIYSRRYSHNTNYFDVIDTEEKAYWLGFILADGYITGNNVIGIAVGDIDSEHIYKFRKAINGDERIHTYVVNCGYKIGTKYSRILIRDSHMFSALQNLGVVKNKSLIAKMPQIDKTLYKHLIRGYFDGNGSITYSIKNGKRKYSLKFCGTFEVLSEIKKLIGVSYGLKISHDKRLNYDTNNYNLDIGGNIQVKRVANYIYNNAMIFLDRKYEKYLEMEKSI